MHIAIIGNGITGVTAALCIRAEQPDWRITLISGESKHHYSRPALMYLFMGHMNFRDTKPFEDHVWERERIELLRAWVTAIDFERKELHLHKQGSLPYDRLLIATGSKSNKFGWPGQDLLGVQGLWDLMDLKALEDRMPKIRHAVLVGGGLIGVELAEMLHSRQVPVTFLVREQAYWDRVLPKEEAEMVTRVVREAGIDLRLQTELKAIEDDGQGEVGAVMTNHGERILCQFVGLTAGVSPNLDLVRNGPLKLGRGILVDSSLRTSIPEVFAAGDCAEIVWGDGRPNTLQQVWYTGKMQGEVAGAVMAEKDRRYDPGIWYNSAKFFDLEYQTYGQVNFQVPGEQSLYWEDRSGKKAIRIVSVDGRVIGINLMGLRYRHEVCARWIAERWTVDAVLDDLSEANFDPEFFTRHESEIAKALRA